MSKASDQAYQILRTKILDGAFAPGAQLKEVELAKLCRVSRTPVRAAIRRLENEMLVRRTKSQRSYVAEWSSEDIEEVYTLRMMLESHAAERAATTVTEATIRAMKRSLEAIIKLLRRRTDPRAFLEHNREFHRLILDASLSKRLHPMLTRLVPQPVVDRTVLRYDQPQMRRSIREHRDILRALEQHDPMLARALMMSHIRRGYHTYVNLDADD